MTGWTALVPVKLVDPKTRLSSVFDMQQRHELMMRLTQHVLRMLNGCEGIDSLVMLSQQRPDWYRGEWRCDEGQSLNDAIAAFRKANATAPLVVLHADLPAVVTRDIDALLRAAERHGIALATDRAGQGTNALALADGRDFDFCFGPDSRTLHQRQDWRMPVLNVLGLAADLDTPEDLMFLRAQGYFSALSCPSEG